MVKYAMVTGGAGFIGSNLVRRLIGLGYYIIVIDNLSTGSLNNIRTSLDKIKVIKGDCSTFSTIELPNLEIIYHLGMPSSSPMYKNNPKLVGETIKTFIQIFERVKRDFPQVKIVYASTSSIYNGNETPYREDMQIYSKDYYSECRYAMERLARLYYGLHAIESIGLRFFSIYGPHEEYKGNYANMITQFLWKIKKCQNPVVYGDGNQSRDFVYVEDAMSACILAAKSKIGCDIFNVGTGIETNFNQIIELLNSQLGTSVKPRYTKNPIENYVQNTLADTTKATKDLGFTAKYTLEEGIAKTINYYKRMDQNKGP
ncbi:MAG: NAD-dependent epimerase/dehydratase family protein [Promethearchaeota archaeon]